MSFRFRYEYQEQPLVSLAALVKEGSLQTFGA
jgi:hypothetical protein